MPDIFLNCFLFFFETGSLLNPELTSLSGRAGHELAPESSMSLPARCRDYRCVYRCMSSLLLLYMGRNPSAGPHVCMADILLTESSISPARFAGF